MTRRFLAVLFAASLAALPASAALAAQQLNKSQTIQFLTSKTLRTSNGTTSVWSTNGTYRISSGGGWVNGRYSVSDNGQVCWRAQNGSTGCFVVLKDGNTYYGRGGSGTWRYR